MDFGSLGKRILENTVASYAVSFVNPGQKLINGEGAAVPYMQIAVNNTLANDLVSFYRGEGSHIINMDYKTVGDNLAYNSLWAWTAVNSPIGPSIKEVTDMVPTPSDGISNSLLDGTLNAAGSLAKELLISNPMITQSPMVYLLKPVTALTSMY